MVSITFGEYILLQLEFVNRQGRFILCSHFVSFLFPLSQYLALSWSLAFSLSLGPALSAYYSALFPPSPAFSLLSPFLASSPFLSRSISVYKYQFLIRKTKSTIRYWVHFKLGKKTVYLNHQNQRYYLQSSRTGSRYNRSLIRLAIVL